MSYHIRKIEKGKIGEFSKIREEFEELTDAVEQSDKVLQICELTDLIGAIELFSTAHFGLSINDLKKFSDKTQTSFLSGKRK
jgi:phosphoribosyl-ATP pyrophosphohydrolase